MIPTSSSTRCTCFAVLSLLAFVSSVFVLSFVRAAEDQGAPKLRVLIFSGLNNHDWRSTTPAIEKMFRDCSRFGTVDVTDTPADLDAGRLAAYDVIVSNWTPYPDTRRTWRPELEAAFLDFVRSGGGFVVIHAAACTFQVWPEFQDLDCAHVERELHGPLGLSHVQGLRRVPGASDRQRADRFPDDRRTVSQHGAADGSSAAGCVQGVFCQGTGRHGQV